MRTNLVVVHSGGMATAEQIRAELAGAPRLVVLDDDPTGTQTVRDLPVLTRWAVGDIRWAIDRSFALDDIHTAHAYMMQAQHFGKIVLTID